MRLTLLALLLLDVAAAAQTPDTLQASRRDPREPLSQTTLFAANVAAQSALTLGRGLAEGGTMGDAPAFLLGGAAAGAGFWGAKRLVGAQHPVAGFALAYVSASLAENVAEGGHALSHARVGLGPLDVRIATPFAREGRPRAAFEIEPLSVAAAVVLPLRGFRPRPCPAGVCYRGEAPVRIQRGGRTFRRLGRTVGRVVRLWPPLSDRTAAHEGVHVVQGMQVEAATPYASIRRILARPGSADITLDARVDWLLPAVGAVTFALSRYERAWVEREAVTMAGSDLGRATLNP